MHQESTRFPHCHSARGWGPLLLRPLLHPWKSLPPFYQNSSSLSAPNSHPLPGTRWIHTQQTTSMHMISHRGAGTSHGPNTTQNIKAIPPKSFPEAHWILQHLCTQTPLGLCKMSSIRMEQRALQPNIWVHIPTLQRTSYVITICKLPVVPRWWRYKVTFMEKGWPRNLTEHMRSIPGGNTRGLEREK